MALFSVSMILLGVGVLIETNPKIFTNHLYHLLFVPLFNEEKDDKNTINE